jgi:hypothetical protein
MDPIIVLRKERERITREVQRLTAEGARLDRAIELLAGLNDTGGESSGNLINEQKDGPPFDIKQYGEWRRIIKYILIDAGRFISWRQITERVRLLGLEVDAESMEKSLRNALYGLKSKEEAFIYKMPSPPYAQVWGWKDFYDPAAKQAKPGYEPRV